eukprot:100717_1
MFSRQRSSDGTSDKGNPYNILSSSPATTGGEYKRNRIPKRSKKQRKSQPKATEKPSKDQMNRFMWIYQHQNKVVYSTCLPGNKTTSKQSECEPSQTKSKGVYKVKRLCNEQWCQDGKIEGKYVRQLGSERYNCQRAKQRG